MQIVLIPIESNEMKVKTIIIYSYFWNLYKRTHNNINITY